MTNASLRLLAVLRVQLSHPIDCCVPDQEAIQKGLVLVRDKEYQASLTILHRDLRGDPASSPKLPDKALLWKLPASVSKSHGTNDPGAAGLPSATAYLDANALQKDIERRQNFKPEDNSNNSNVPKAWHDQKFLPRSDSSKSSLMILQDGFARRRDLHIFGLEVVRALQGKGNVIHLLGNLSSDFYKHLDNAKFPSGDDVLRQLALQSLELCHPYMPNSVEYLSWLAQAAFNKDWLLLMSMALRTKHCTHIVVNTSILRNLHADSESWPSFFEHLLDSLAPNVVKVIIITDRPMDRSMPPNSGAYVIRRQTTQGRTIFVKESWPITTKLTQRPPNVSDVFWDLYLRKAYKLRIVRDSSQNGRTGAGKRIEVVASIEEKLTPDQNANLGIPFRHRSPSRGKQDQPSPDKPRASSPLAAKPEEQKPPEKETKGEPKEASAEILSHDPSSSSITGPANDWFKTLEDTTHRTVYAHENSTPNSYEPIKVAILDTGFAYTESGDKKALKPYAHRIKKYATFMEGRQDKDARADQHGHGTAVAVQLLKTCRNALLYICQVAAADSDGGGDSKVVPDKNAVEKAIRKAASPAPEGWGVDIINMSFGWPYNDHPGVDRAIKMAAENGVHMFAATSNSGLLGPPNDILFPSRSNYVIAVDAAHGLGEHTDTTASSTSQFGKGRRFSAPGVGLTCPAGSSPFLAAQKTWSGSSFACPIAAGTCALLLEFARQAPMKQSASAQTRLRDMTAMVALLRKMSSEKGPDGFKFLVPWKLLGKIGDPRTITTYMIIDELRKEFGQTIGSEIDYLWSNDAGGL